MNDNRIYLLTGAAGFLGFNICLQLLEKGAVEAYRMMEDSVSRKSYSLSIAHQFLTADIQRRHTRNCIKTGEI